MNNIKKSEKGLSLVELLATIVIASIISLFLFNMITSAMENNRVIQQENMLRDEADLIMSKMIKALYSTNQNAIIHNSTTNDESNIKLSNPTSCTVLPNNIYKNTSTCQNYYLEVSTNISKCTKNQLGELNNRNECITTLKPIGFYTESNVTKTYILDEIVEPSVPAIKILPTSKVIGDPKLTNNYEVLLHLEITQKRNGRTYSRDLTFRNEIQPIVQTNGY